MTTSIDVTLGQVAGALALVALAVAISFWRRADLERDIVVATIRSFVQLIAIGYVIKLIFEADTHLAGRGAARGDGPLRGTHRPQPRQARSPALSGHC